MSFRTMVAADLRALTSNADEAGESLTHTSLASGTETDVWASFMTEDAQQEQAAGQRVLVTSARACWGTEDGEPTPAMGDKVARSSGELFFVVGLGPRGFGGVVVQLESRKVLESSDGWRAGS